MINKKTNKFAKNIVKNIPSLRVIEGIKLAKYFKKRQLSNIISWFQENGGLEFKEHISCGYCELCNCNVSNSVFMFRGDKINIDIDCCNGSVVQEIDEAYNEFR